jgi:hypothetical protein
MTMRARLLILVLLPSVLVACASTTPVESISAAPAFSTPEPPQPSDAVQVGGSPAADCPATTPDWIMPPDDAAIQNPPALGYYIVNDDQSIWVSAWWAEQDATPLQAGDDGNKIGWFRPAGAPLEITGRLLDADGTALHADIPCCYPTRFQATGLAFPVAGCWEITAKAADSELTFVVVVAPSETMLGSPHGLAGPRDLKGNG